MIKWTRTSRLSTKKSLSVGGLPAAPRNSPSSELKQSVTCVKDMRYKKQHPPRTLP